MPRFPRSYIQTTFFHVITQGINKSYIYEYPEDIKYYIKIMYELEKELDIKLISYCIMHRLNTRYAIYYNKKYSRVGYIFKNRYKSEGIYSEEHLYNCIKYIYDNPVKAGICKCAQEYPYSNYKNYGKDIRGNYIFLDVDINSEELCRELIEEFLTVNSVEKHELKKDICRLKELINILKKEYNISLRQISKELNINREKIRKIYNK